MVKRWVAGVTADDLDAIGDRCVPLRLTMRTVSPRARRASMVARPMAPVPKMRWRGLVLLMTGLRSGWRGCAVVTGVTVGSGGRHAGGGAGCRAGR